ERGVPNAFQLTGAPAARRRCAALGLTRPVRASALSTRVFSPWKLNSRAGGLELAPAGTPAAAATGTVKATARNATTPRLRPRWDLSIVLAPFLPPPPGGVGAAGRDGTLRRGTNTTGRGGRRWPVGSDFYAPPCAVSMVWADYGDTYALA